MKVTTKLNHMIKRENVFCPVMKCFSLRNNANARKALVPLDDKLCMSLLDFLYSLSL
jgi:hypothetical protein